MIILVVDDEPDARELARMVLERADHEVLVARHPDEALQVLNATDVDLVLTDLHMPRMDGQQLARTIHDLYPDVPCVVWSDVGDGDDDGVQTKDFLRLQIDEWTGGTEADAVTATEERA